MEIESSDYKLRKNSKKPAKNIVSVVDTRPIQAIQPIQAGQPMNISIEDEIYYVVEENLLEETNDSKSELEFSELAEEEDIEEIQEVETPEKKFKPRSSLTPKAKTKDKIKELTCKECSKTFKRATQLQVHQRSHTNERPFCCPIKGCGKAFRLNHHLQVINFHSNRIVYSIIASTSSLINEFTT